jgi:hypothetical protein
MDENRRNFPWPTSEKARSSVRRILIGIIKQIEFVKNFTNFSCCSAGGN